MTPDEIAEATADRLDRWGRFLREHRATPVLVLGLKHPENELVLATVDGLTDTQLHDALMSAAAMIRAGMILRGEFTGPPPAVPARRRPDSSEPSEAPQ